MLKKHLKTNEIIGKFVMIIAILAFTAAMFFNATAEAEEGIQLAKNSGGSYIREKQVMEVNESLKNVIEENQVLADQNDKLQVELQRLKKERMSSQNDYSSLKKSLDKVRSTNREYSKEIKSLERSLTSLKKQNQQVALKANSGDDIYGLNSSWISGDDVMQLASATDEEVTERESKTIDLLTQIDAFAEEDQRLKEDSAKAHYNMGNIYFQKGEYEIAVREYYQAVTLMPDDPDSHYNLAFVSGEYLNDHKTALKHYQMYLYLNPNAKDVKFVKEKILKAKLFLKGKVDSPLEER